MKAPAGYSGKPLVAKLGLKEGFRVSFIREPAHYRALLGAFPAGTMVLGARARDLDFVHLFAISAAGLTRDFAQAKKRIKPAGTLWVSWPKRTSTIKSDLDENVVRRIGLAGGLVDVKVAAIDDDWSALKFVYRVKDRR